MNLPLVRQLFVDKPGGLVVASLVCPVLHQLRVDGICQDGAHARGASKPASKFVDGSPWLECVKSMELTASSHRSCFFCCSRESRDELCSVRGNPH